MLARREYHPPECDHPPLLDRLANHGVSLPADIAFRRDVVGNVQIEIVYLVSRYELIDLDRMRAFDGYRLEFRLGYFDVLSLANFIAHDDVFITDLLTRHGVGRDQRALCDRFSNCGQSVRMSCGSDWITSRISPVVTCVSNTSNTARAASSASIGGVFRKWVLILARNSSRDRILSGLPAGRHAS